MSHEARQVPSWLIFDVGRAFGPSYMKSVRASSSRRQRVSADSGRDVSDERSASRVFTDSVQRCRVIDRLQISYTVSAVGFKPPSTTSNPRGISNPLLRWTESPNKAPEPTRPLVMPRALSRNSEMKPRTQVCFPARVTPSGRVAHL